MSSASRGKPSILRPPKRGARMFRRVKRIAQLWPAFVGRARAGMRDATEFIFTA